DIRSGINSLPVGQAEAARSLGLSKAATYRYVVIPQAIKNIWPALGNEFITLLKDSSLVSIIGVAETMYQTQLVQTSTYQGVFPLVVAMAIYFIMTFTLTRILSYMERRMNYHD
ncbi:MAG: amino acid ABC transporter permease, partial [Lactobacillus iners]|nr:amino acid ABC transporter permease [Lactobacillus iners]